MNKKITIVALLFVVGIVLGLFYANTKTDEAINQEKENKQKAVTMVRQGDLFFDKSTSETYNIEKADEAYHKALQLDPNNERALYQATRVHYVQGEFITALEYGDEYVRKFPNKKRIHYVLGLTNAYAGHLDEAVREFKKFIDSSEANEAGYLDIAWVYFQKGEYEVAKKYLEDGIQKYGDNVWLNISLAMNKFNLGEDKKEVLSLLDKAEKEANELTLDIWKTNYSSNNPNDYKKDIEKIKNIIQINKKIVQGEDVVSELSKLTKGLNIEGISPKGVLGGYVVSACCASNKGAACNSSRNKCSQYSRGSIKCNGSCNVSKPSDSYCRVKTWRKDYWQDRKKVIPNCANVKDNKITWTEWKLNKAGTKYERTGIAELEGYLLTKNREQVVVENITNPSRPSYVTEGNIIDNQKTGKDLGFKPNNKMSKKDDGVLINPFVHRCYYKESKPKNGGGYCGNGRVEGAEECDNGKSNGKDGKCNSECKIGDDKTNPEDDDPTKICGNGRIDPGEQCDNGDENGIDGKCTLACQSENTPDFCSNHPDDPSCNQQDPINVDMSWSTDKIHWNDNFDQLILLKSTNEKVYVKDSPGSGECKKTGVPMLNLFTLALPNAVDHSKSLLSIVDRKITADKSLMVSFSADPDTMGTAFAQPVNIDYCSSTPDEDKEKTLHIKIVDIKQEEI